MKRLFCIFLAVGVILSAGTGVAGEQEKIAAQSQGMAEQSKIVHAVPPDSTKVNAGDTAWILMSAALVMLMSPGLALFYGGAVAGLATITPAAGFVEPWAALLIGLMAGIFCYSGVVAKNKFRYDENLDVVGIHGVGGTLGALAIGLFATKAVNESGNNGLLFG